MSGLILTKLAQSNKCIDTVIGGTVCEYDIASAGATAIRYIKGEDTYNSLMLLDKDTRNKTIGLMQRDEKGLAQKINSLMLEWLNLFIKSNNITLANFIYSTRDSVVIYNKIPMKTTFGHVHFRNKDGIFSSLYNIGRTTLFYDSMRDLVICKGVKDETVNDSVFLQKFLVKHLRRIESFQKQGDSTLMGNLTHMRNDYLNASNIEIYRDLYTENKFCVRFGDKVSYFDSYDGSDEEFVIAKDLNYRNVVMPIMRSALYNG